MIEIQLNSVTCSLRRWNGVVAYQQQGLSMPLIFRIDHVFYESNYWQQRKGKSL